MPAPPGGMDTGLRDARGQGREVSAGVARRQEGTQKGLMRGHGRAPVFRRRNGDRDRRGPRAGHRLDASAPRRGAARQAAMELWYVRGRVRSGKGMTTMSFIWLPPSFRGGVPGSDPESACAPIPAMTSVPIYRG